MALGNLGSRDYAHRLYNQNQAKGQPIDAIPRSKFTFLCSLNTINGPVELDRISSVTMPSWSSKATTMLSYNKKKVVQTGIDYSPVTLIAYDTKKPAAIETFLKEYADYYFAGPMNVEDRTEHLIGGKGFKLQQDKNYIQEFKITRTGGGDNNIITLYNPVIQSVDADTLDYSDSSLVQYRISFVYEGYDIKSL